jgi:hypothetical protein
MSSKVALTVVVILLAATATARAQAACDTPNALIERVYVEVSSTTALDSGLIMTIGDGSPIAMTRDSNAFRWFVDLWGAVIVKPVALDALDVRVRKTGWSFTPRTGHQPRSELIGNVARCSIALAFDAVQVWSVRVVAEPDGVDPVLVICQDQACARDSKTEFTTRLMAVNEPFRMIANFGPECTVSITVTVKDLPDKRFSRKTLYEKLPPSCVGVDSRVPAAIANYFAAAYLKSKVPGSISVREVQPR